MKKTLLLFLVCCLLFGIITSQKRSFAHQKDVFEILEDNPLFVPNSKILKNVAFGFDNLMTDLIWLKTVQYIGGNARSGEYPLLSDYLDVLTDLDAKFYMPYFVAQILLPESGQAKEAVLLSEKGMKALPENWKIPYYTGYIYYYYLNDYEKGAKFYTQASEIPGALSSAKRMAVNLIGKANKHALALEMWLNLYEEEKNPDVKNLIEKKMLREKNFVDLENALQKYFQQNGFYPEKIDVLAQFGLIEKIPSDPLEPYKNYTLSGANVYLQ